MKFSEEVEHEARNNREHFRDVAIIPLNAGLLFLFSGFVIIVDIMEKRAYRFPRNFHEMSRTTQEIISWTVYAWLFHDLPSRRGDVSVSNITAKWMNGFLWIFRDISTMTQGTFWNSLGMIGLTPGIQDSFFYVLDPCFLSTLRNNGWWIFITF